MPDEEKVEFKGVSASNEKRNAIVLFIIEAAIILLLAAVIISVLNYFNVLDLSRVPVLSNLPKSTSTNDMAENTSEGTHSEQNSQNNNYGFKAGEKINIENEREFRDLITLWGVYGKTYNSNPAQGRTDDKPVQKITINLTTNRITTYPIYENSTIMSATGVTITPGVMDLHVYVSPDVLKKSREEIENYVQKSVISALYHKGQEHLKTNEDISSDLDMIYKELENKKYISITNYDF